ncbi:hypothetical protein D3C80_1098430 [compost metagenome]
MIASEPAQWRLLAVHSQNAWLAGRQLVGLLVQHDDAVPGNGKPRRAQVHRVLQAMVVAQHHAQLGLPVMVVNGYPQLVGKPADHFRVERLAGATDHPQTALDRCAEFAAGGDQQTIGGRRAGQIADGVFVDDPAGAFNAERAIEKGRGMAQCQRSGDGVVKAVGPARVGEIPEVVFRTQIDGIAHVALEGDDGTQRHFQRLGRAGGTGGEHQQERRVGTQQHRLAAITGSRQRRVEVDITGSVPGTDANDRRTPMHIVELAAVERIGDHYFGARLLQPVLDGFRSEGSEQRLINRTQAPGGQYGDQ